MAAHESYLHQLWVVPAYAQRTIEAEHEAGEADAPRGGRVHHTDAAPDREHQA